MISSDLQLTFSILSFFFCRIFFQLVGDQPVVTENIHAAFELFQLRSGDVGRGGFNPYTLMGLPQQGRVKPEISRYDNY